jgi:hypothetical protein
VPFGYTNPPIGSTVKYDVSVNDDMTETWEVGVVEKERP